MTEKKNKQSPHRCIRHDREMVLSDDQPWEDETMWVCPEVGCTNHIHERTPLDRR